MILFRELLIQCSVPCTSEYNVLFLYLCLCLLSVPPKLEYDARYSGVQEVKAGGTLLLPVSFAGTGPARVRWFRDGVPLLPVRGHVHIDTGEHHRYADSDGHGER